MNFVLKTHHFLFTLLHSTITYALGTTCNLFHLYVDHHKLWKILKEMRIPDHLTCLLRNLYAGQQLEQLEPDVKQGTGSKLGKEYIKAVYCHRLI